MSAQTDIDYSKFRLSLMRLEEQYETHQNIDSILLSLKRLAEQYEIHPNIDNILLKRIREGITESVIQRFETCYDCLWKILRRYLNEELGIADAPNSPKPIFRLAFENNMLSSPLEQWFQYVQARIDTSHDYDGEKALACVDLMSDFIEDAIGLYQTMTTETWE